MSVSHRSACARAPSNASFRTLLPPNAKPSVSSRLISSRGPPPSSSERLDSGSTGVGSDASISTGIRAKAARSSLGVTRPHRRLRSRSPRTTTTPPRATCAAILRGVRRSTRSVSPVMKSESAMMRGPLSRFQDLAHRRSGVAHWRPSDALLTSWSAAPRIGPGATALTRMLSGASSRRAPRSTPSRRLLQRTRQPALSRWSSAAREPVAEGDDASATLLPHRGEPRRLRREMSSGDRRRPSCSRRRATSLSNGVASCTLTPSQPGRRAGRTRRRFA